MSEQAANQFLLGIGFLVIGTLFFSLPAVIIRFAIIRRRLGKGGAAAMAFGSFLLVFTPLWFMTLEGERVSPILPFLVMMATWMICRYEKRRIW